jgi:hypothetical protein
MLRVIGHKFTGKKLAVILLGLGISIFLFSLLVFSGLPKRETFVDKASGLPIFDRILPVGTLIAKESVVVVPDTGRPAYAVGYSLGSQSGVALVIWDAVDERYVQAADRPLPAGISGSVTKPPRLSLEPLGGKLPTLIVVRVAAGEKSEGVFFMQRDRSDLIFTQMTDSFGRTKPAYFIDGDIISRDDRVEGLVTLGSAFFDMQDVDGDGGEEAILYSRSIDMSEGGGWGTSVDAYSWSDGKFIYDKELSYILTKNSGIFPEPPGR